MTDKNTFDPATHTFGMAYRVSGFIVYPYHHCDKYVSYMVEEERIKSPVEMMVRAPEHDLVPRAPVTDEAKQAALKFLNMNYPLWNVPNIGQTHHYPVEVVETIRSALKSRTGTTWADIYKDGTIDELVEALEKCKHFKLNSIMHDIIDTALAKHRNIDK